MFQPKVYGGRTVGYVYEYKHSLFFFGTRHTAEADLPVIFPEYEFCFLQQEHGRAVVLADPSQRPQADAHYTRRATRAVVVKTADCTPILLVSQNQVCAVHAGWKGIANQILAATQSFFADDPVIATAIGPHILFPSFEVGLDVSKQILSSVEPVDSAWTRPHLDPTKTYVNLTAIAKAQIRAIFGDSVPLLECVRDTFTDPEFHSFRRNRQSAGRQMSFVVINS